MKTAKYLLPFLLILGTTGVSQATPPPPAGNDPPQPPPGYTPKAPGLNDSERGGACLYESTLSLLAAYVENAAGNCASVAGDYNVSFSVGPDGNGLAQIEFGSMVLSNTLAVAPTKGAKCQVTGTSGQIRGVPIDSFDGHFAWNPKNTILVGEAPVIKIGGHDFDEHVIKDFYLKGKYVYDWGLEVVTKLGFPRSKWWQTSTYLPPDGVDGSLEITKQRITPKNSCKLTLKAQGDNAGGDWVFAGTVNISK